MALLTKRRNSISISALTESDMKDNVPKGVQDILKLVQLTHKDIENLHSIDDIMEKHAADMAERHYEMIMEIDEIREIFNQYTNHDRYTSAIIAYFKQLTKPEINQEYIQYRKKIGQIHSQIKLTEEWYLGSYIRVYEYLVPFITDRFKSNPKKLADVLVALNKMITFDSIIVIEAYREANEFIRIENISAAMDEVTKIDEVGNLLFVVDETITEANEVNKATRQLNKDINEISDTVSDASKQAELMVEKGKRKQKCCFLFTGRLS